MKPVNLIPTDQRRAQATGARPGSSYILIGVLVTLLAMTAAYALTAKRATERQNEATAAEAEADRLEAEVAQRGAYTNFAQIKAARVASVSTIASTRFDWERLMRELSRVIPAGSWVQTTDASATGDVSGANPSASSAGTETTAAGPKVNLVGCTPNQEDAARMMVRLRQLHRVSDVELNESVKEIGGGNDVSIDNCGSMYKFDIVVSFQPAETQTEAPRGESTVPASLGGGS
jgi:Tfp pilus assembly protein PilN